MCHLLVCSGLGQSSLHSIALHCCLHLSPPTTDMQLSAVAARRLAAAAAAAALQNTTTTTNKGTVVTTDNITQTVPSSVAIADDDHHDDESDASTVHSITSSSPHSSVNLSLASLPLSPPPTSSRGTKRKRTHDENIASPTTASGVTFPLPRRRVHDDR